MKLIDTGPSERGWHRLESILTCPQRYAFGALSGIHEAAAPLVRGTLGHIGLAHYYARLMAAQRGADPAAYYPPLDAVDEKVKRLQGTNEGPLALEFQEPVKKAVLLYMQEFTQERFKIVGVEAPASINLEGYRVTQRLDLAIEMADGGVWLWDHKFVAAASTGLDKRYTLSGQFLLMNYMGRFHFKERFQGIRVNLIGMEDGKFKRLSPSPAPGALAEFPRTVRHAEELIASLVGTDPWAYPKVFSELTCITPYGPCPHFERCQWGK